MPGKKWWAKKGRCTKSKDFEVAVSHVAKCSSGRKIEGALSKSVTKDFIYKGNQGCFHRPMFQPPKPDENKPKGGCFTAYRWYVKNNGKWYLQYEGNKKSFVMSSRAVDKRTMHGALPATCDEKNRKSDDGSQEKDEKGGQGCHEDHCF